MSRDVGVLRDEAGLEHAVAELSGLAETSDAALLALMIARAALGRRESRGGHFRTDYPAAGAGIVRTLSYAHDVLAEARAAHPQRRAS